MEEIANRIVTKLKSLKETRGPDVMFLISVDTNPSGSNDSIAYQGIVGDWSQDLIDENRLIDFENMINGMYGTGVWV
jgi:hypothetical protein